MYQYPESFGLRLIFEILDLRRSRDTFPAKMSNSYSFIYVICQVNFLVNKQAFLTFIWLVHLLNQKQTIYTRSFKERTTYNGIILYFLQLFMPVNCTKCNTTIILKQELVWQQYISDFKQHICKSETSSVHVSKFSSFTCCFVLTPTFIPFISPYT